MGLAPERRHAPRTAAARPAKVYHVPSRRYLPAQTCNLSGSGALLRINDDRLLLPGESLEVHIQWMSTPFLHARDHIKAKVVRVLASNGQQLAAVEFADALDAALDVALIAA